MSDTDCIIVGAGLAGLACAKGLVRAGRRVLVLDAADRPGGRVATDTVAGFRIDRGFQVYLEAYPEGQRQLDVGALRCGWFEPGALVIEGKRLREVSDPWRRPLAAVRSLLSGAVGLDDAFRILGLRRACLARAASGSLGPASPAAAGEESTRAALRRAGFSDAFVARFFSPFFGGVFLERALDTSEAIFAFTFAMFARGRAGLPHGGMAAIPAQLASDLPAGSIRTAARVAAVEPGAVTLSSGERLAARDVIVAAEADAAARLVPGLATKPRHWKGTRMLAFAAPRSPLGRPILVVGADAGGVIDNLVVPSDVVGGYAPAGEALVTVTVRPGSALGDADAIAAVRAEAARLFGAGVQAWRHLETIHVPRALPDETPAARATRPASPRVGDGLFVCGDWCATASINGALASGRMAAEAVLAEGPRHQRPGDGGGRDERGIHPT